MSEGRFLPERVRSAYTGSGSRPPGAPSAAPSGGAARSATGSGCSAEEKSSLALYDPEPFMFQAAPAAVGAQTRDGASVVPCIGRRVTGGRAARTRMPPLKPFRTPLRNPLYIFRRRLKTLLQRPNGISRVTQSHAAGGGIFPAAHRLIRFTGQALSVASVGCGGAVKACGHGIRSPLEDGSGTEPAVNPETERMPSSL